MPVEDSSPAVWETSPEHLNTILNQFGLKLIEAETRRKVWLLKTSEGFKFLKRSRLTQVDIRFIDDVLEYLHSRSFESVPRLLKCITGEPYAAYSNALYIMTDWMPSAELNFRSPADTADAARFLAQFHRRSCGFVPNPPNYRTDWANWPEKLAARLMQLEDFYQMARPEEDRSDFSRLYLRYFEPFYREAVQSSQALQTSYYHDVAAVAARSMIVCHHDFSDRNLLRTPSGDLFLVDFDYCCRDMRIHDIINFMGRILKHRGWKAEISRIIIEEYHKIYPLFREELEVMHILMQWPHDFWQVGLQYYCEKLPWPKERFLAKLEHQIKNRPAREKFLAEFPERNGLFQF